MVKIFYGVGALDSDPIKTGSEYAKHGWDTPEKLSVVILFTNTSYHMMIKIRYTV